MGEIEPESNKFEKHILKGITKVNSLSGNGKTDEVVLPHIAR
jgi:hypothetical protein